MSSSGWKLNTTIPSLAQTVVSLIDTEDAEEKKTYAAKIIKDLGVTKDAPKNLTSVIKELRQLAYAGLTETQNIFATAMQYYVGTVENREILFHSASGRDVLNRLIFSTSWPDQSTSEIAKKALKIFTENNNNFSGWDNFKIIDFFSSFYNNIFQNLEFLGYLLIVPLEDYRLLGWSINKIFQKTLCKEDESLRHVFSTFESAHPYNSNTAETWKVFVPDAMKLILIFDKRCNIDGDSLMFFEDEAMRKPLVSINKKLMCVVNRINFLLNLQVLIF